MPRTAKQVEAYNMSQSIENNFDNNEINDTSDNDIELMNIPLPAKQTKKPKQSTVTATTVANVGQTLKRKKNDTMMSPFEHTLMNLNEVESTEIEHKIQLGNQFNYLIFELLNFSLSDKRNGIGVINGNICFFKYWTKNNEMNFSKMPFEINPKLMPRIVHSFKILNDKMKK
jgi:hypothetical protein